MATQDSKNLVLKNVLAGLDIFDPFQGLVDDDTGLNLRYGFRLGDINFLIRQSMMCEVIQKPTIFPIPNTPSWIRGLINLRGILVPVLNIEEHLERRESEEKSDNLLVIDRGERAFGIFINALPDSINLDEEQLTPTTIPKNIPGVLKRFIIGAFSLNEETWLDIDYDGFIKHITRDYSKQGSGEIH